MSELFDPLLDLQFARFIDVSVGAVWDAWTQPDLLMPWFCPLPWRTVQCEIDLRPGGRFFTVMRSPEGQDHPNTGCYLEVVAQRRLVWTSALEGGYRPIHQASPGFAFTAVVAMEPRDGGTFYSAKVLHADEAARQTHADMGFEQGWGMALDQMVAMIKKRAECVKKHCVS